MRTSRRNMVPLRAAALLVLAAAAHTASAQIISGTLSNFDVWNRTGQTANDFEATFGGIPQDRIAGLYRGDYPTTTVTTTGGTTTVRWTGSTTPPNQKSHFGIRLSGPINPSNVNFTWTFDGRPIGGIPDPWQKWLQLTSGVRDVIAPTQAAVWVQRRTNITTATIDLPDLLRSGALWESGITIDEIPVRIAAGAELIYDFDWTGQNFVNFVMMYDVWSDDNGQRGDLIATFLNAAVVVPAPAPIAGLALLGLVASRRRRS